MNGSSNPSAAPCGICNVHAKVVRITADMVEPRRQVDLSRRLIRAARELSDSVGRLRFSPPVTHVYNPLAYAWLAHRAYLERFACAPKRVLFLGMNPGPFGMVQTGVPFGEVAAVRVWLQLEAAVERPTHEHPRRPILGFACPRSEVSGHRLWGLFAQRFGSAQKFFAEHLVLNYCPLAFLETTGRNRTPDKLPAAEREALFALCDEHLRAVVRALHPEWVIAVGDFAFRRAEFVFTQVPPRLGRIHHPSPANPRANRDWAGLVTRQLRELTVWS